jgi:hypothetical protein
MARQTRIPSGLNEEQDFLATSFVSLSLRQLLSLTFGVLSWFIVGSIIGNITFGRIFGLVLMLPLLIGGLVLAFGRRDGRNFEEWLSDRLVFALESRRYGLVGKERPAEALAEDIEWAFAFEESDDDE